MRYEQMSNACMSPIHRQVIDAEQLLLAKMKLALLRCGLVPRDLK